jgi:hypothetical protein
MRYVKICLFILSLVLAKRFCFKQTDGFALHKIHSPLPYCLDWETTPLPAEDNGELMKILDQPFDYLARGAQAYVFASRDRKTVIKFFRVYHLMPPLWMTCLNFPPPLQPYKIAKMIRKREGMKRDFQSYKIAFEELKEETGVLYVHLNKTSDLNKKLTIYTKIGIAHEVDLDGLEFIVQKRASLFYPSIEQFVHEEGIESAKGAISSLIQLLQARRGKGIYDKDPDLLTNFGFIGKTPVQIDIGRFSKWRRAENQENSRDEIIRITDDFRKWLDEKYPPLSEHLLAEIEKIPVSPKKPYPFSKETIQAPLSRQNRWEGRPQTDDEIKQTEAALSQSYRFLGGGGQCFAFVSEDGKFVIKFFKQKKIEKDQAKKKRVFSAFQLSFDRLPEETGIFYIHLNPTEHLHKTLVFCDYNGKEHLLNLDGLQFVIQKKAILANHHLEELMAKQDLEGAKRAVDQLLSLWLKLHRKGIYNRDPDFSNNYGFADEKPMLIDVGRIAPSQKSKQEELAHFTKEFRIYLANRCPELVDYFDEVICEK